MPAASSMIRTVPGGNVGPAGGGGTADGRRRSATASARPRTGRRPGRRRRRATRTSSADADDPARRGRARRTRGLGRRHRRRAGGARRGQQRRATGRRRPGRPAWRRRTSRAVPPAHQARRAVGVGVPARRRGRLAGSGHGLHPRTRQPLAGYRVAASPGRSRRPCPSAPADAAVVARLRAAGCVFAEDEAPAAAGRGRDARPSSSALVDRRVAGEPLEHLLGWAEFCGLRIAVAPGVFVPRRRTELLVARRRRPRPARRRRRRPVLRLGRRGRRAGRRGRRASSCTPPTSTRPPWLRAAQPAAAAAVHAGRPVRRRCPPACAGGSTCWSPTCPTCRATRSR